MSFAHGLAVAAFVLLCVVCYGGAVAIFYSILKRSGYGGLGSGRM